MADQEEEKKDERSLGQFVKKLAEDLGSASIKTKLNALEASSVWF